MSETRAIRRSRLGLASTACLLAVIAGAAPAKADGVNAWNSFLGFFGMGPNNPADNAIDYTAQPVLVVPPKMDLPPPQAAAAHPTNWPNDPDAAARRRAEADSRRPAPPSPAAQSNDGSDDAQPTQAQPAAAPAAAVQEQSEVSGDKQASVPWSGTSDASHGTGDKRVYAPWGGHGGAVSTDQQQGCNQIAGMPVCLGSWDWFGFAKSDDTKAVRTLKVGVEPQREYLTQPPPGYRAPVAADTDQGNDQSAAAAPAATH